jgi:DNA transformation protein
VKARSVAALNATFQQFCYPGPTHPMKKRDDLLDYVLDQLRGVRSIEARSMFGGFGLYRDGLFFGIVFEGRFFMRTSPSTRSKYVNAGMTRFRPNARQTLKSYYEVPQEVLDDATTLACWAEEAVRGSTDSE